MDQSASGGCLCGGVTFTVTGTFAHFFLCHCTRCRRGSGAAHAANLFALEAQLTWHSGAEKVRAFRLPGSRHARSFCSDCGAPLPHREDPAGPVLVPVGALDGPPPRAPDAHICWADRAPWEEALASLERLDGQPS